MWIKKNYLISIYKNKEYLEKAKRVSQLCSIYKFRKEKITIELGCYNSI